MDSKNFRKCAPFANIQIELNDVYTSVSPEETLTFVPIVPQCRVSGRSHKMRRVCECRKQNEVSTEELKRVWLSPGPKDGTFVIDSML
ncbi:hypothetical protein T265_07204 [Opisthorchis viverrini]|uniref:Uncharacterized protein n=1 Tax=Opisthorchis viverrini TaxID=6198 RepID=A0A075AC90_OPIVI|nr:hypothetical protein T265_07204 [Opisthorchis viverrini]KER25329.1 hypothetical protein T265_07204 [Opisthorchis viverrini]